MRTLNTVLPGLTFSAAESRTTDWDTRAKGVQPGRSDDRPSRRRSEKSFTSKEREGSTRRLERTAERTEDRGVQAVESSELPLRGREGSPLDSNSALNLSHTLYTVSGRSARSQNTDHSCPFP